MFYTSLERGKAIFCISMCLLPFIPFADPINDQDFTPLQLFYL